jgi:hypothetical protein
MEPILGYRAWLADREGRLRSVSMDHVWWEPGRAVEATCYKPVHRFDDTARGPAPHDVNHPCGWHAYSTLAALLADRADGMEPRETTELSLVRGIVEGGGRTVEHEHGWRAQFALPVAIIRFVPDDPQLRSRVLLAQYLAGERYGIDLIDIKDA